MPANTLEKKISIDSFFQNLDEISGELDRVDKKTDQALQEVKSSSIKAFSNENYFESLLKSLTEQEEIVQKVSSENQQQNTTINNLTNVVNQEGDTVKQTIVNQNQITNQVSEVGDRVKSLEKSGEKVVDQILNLKKENNTENQQLSKAFQVLKQSYDSLSSGVQSVRTDVEGISEYLLKDQQQRRNLLEQRKLKKARETDVKEKSNIMSALKKALGSTKDQEMFGNIMSQQDYAAIKNPPGGGAAGGGGGLGGGALAAAGVGVAAGALGTMMGGDSASPGSSGSGGGGGSVGTPEQKALLDAISFAEGTSKSYGTVFGGKVIPELEKGEMTVAQVLEMQKTGKFKGIQYIPSNSYNSDATGRYQFMSYTLKEEVQKQGIPMDAKFTPSLQDKLILGRIARFRKVTPELLKKEGLSAKVSNMLAPEFASLPTYSGKSYYGQPVKSLKSVQEKYKQSLGSQSTAETAAKPAGTPQAAAGTPQAGAPQAASGAAPSYLPDPSKSLGANLRDLTSSAGTPGTAQQSMMPPASGVDQKVSQTASQISSAQPQMKQMDPSSIVPFDTQQVASGGYSQAPQNQGQQSNITSTPDFPEAIPTSNPLTKMWTLSAINHLNINGSMDHIYG